jgi:hypothetical protein
MPTIDRHEWRFVPDADIRKNSTMIGRGITLE